MHIALIISSLGSGGAERVITALANHWDSQGHRVTVITLSLPDTKPFYLLNSKIGLIQLGKSKSKVSSFGRLKNIIKRLFYLRLNFKKLDPDVIISFVDVMNLTTLLASIGLQIPVIVSERIDPHFHAIPKLYQKIRPFLYRFAQRIVVQTNSAASYFSNHLQSKMTIIPNPVTYVDHQKSITTSQIKAIVTVGRLHAQKDHATPIQAFDRIHIQYPNLRLTIYGEGIERESLIKLIYTLHLQEKVFLPGATQDIHQKLILADLFVFPSLYEGFPNALCEAMAVGLPVIASNCSGNIDVVRDEINGRLFPVGNALKLADVMKELINDSPQRQRLSAQAQTISQRFHASHIFHMWDQVLAKATEHNE